MANKVASFGTAITAPTMLDDQKALMHANPLDAAGNPTTLPSGSVPTYAVGNPGSVVSLDPTVDPTGATCEVLGIKGMAGTDVVTVSLTNADGTVATGSASFTTTIDPAELGVVSFGPTVDPAVAQ